MSTSTAARDAPSVAAAARSGGRRKPRVQRDRGPRTRWLWLVVAVLVTLPSLLPLVWLVSTAFKNYIQTQILPPRLIATTGPTWMNFQQLLASPQTLVYVRNSIIVTVVVMALVLLLALPASYALARFKFRKARDIQFWIISLRMLPPMAVVVPVYLVFSAIGLTGSLIGIILMLTMINASFAVWLCTTFFEEVPIEIEEAAQLDGLTRVQSFLRVSLPLTRTGIFTVMGFVFIFAWNELPFALVLSGQASQTFPVFLSTFSSITLINYGLMASACIIHIIPVLIVTALLQRHLVEGLSFGAVK